MTYEEYFYTFFLIFPRAFLSALVRCYPFLKQSEGTPASATYGLFAKVCGLDAADG